MREASCDCTKHWHCPRCSGANVAWEKPQRWYCLDCGHELPNPIAASSPAGGEFGQCQECGCTTGGGDYCWQHRPYTVYPLKDGTWRETRNGLTRVIESNCNRCSELHADAARPRSALRREVHDKLHVANASDLSTYQGRMAFQQCEDFFVQLLAEARSSPVEARRLAEAIADRLFVNGGGERADRLVLTVDGPTKRDLGGWCRGAVVDQVEAALSSPGATEPSKE